MIIPAHDEEATVADVVHAVLTDCDEVIVVASACSDRTPERATRAGARVVVEPLPGKHRAVRAGLDAARGTNVAFIDADLVSPIKSIADRLFCALEPDVSLAKGYYSRVTDDEARLTEICARPLLCLVRPTLARIRDPLAGEFAAARERLCRWPAAPGFAVDIGFLMLAAQEGRIAEVDLGEKRHKHRSAADLGEAAVQVACAILGPRCVPDRPTSFVRRSMNGWTESAVETTWLPPNGAFGISDAVSR